MVSAGRGPGGASGSDRSLATGPLHGAVHMCLRSLEEYARGVGLTIETVEPRPRLSGPVGRCRCGTVRDTTDPIDRTRLP